MVALSAHSRLMCVVVVLLLFLAIQAVDARTLTRTLLFDINGATDAPPTTNDTFNESESPPDTEAPFSTDAGSSSAAAPTSEAPPAGNTTSNSTESPTTEQSTSINNTETMSSTPTVTTLITTTAAPDTTTEVPPMPPPTTTSVPVTLPPGSTPIFRAILHTGTTTAQFRANLSVALGVPPSTISVESTATILYDPLTGAVLRNIVSRRGFVTLSFVTTTEVNFTLTGSGSATAAATVALLNPTPALLTSLPTFGISASFVATTAVPPTTSHMPAPTTTLRPVVDSAAINDQERATIIGISVSVGSVLLIAFAVCLLKRLSDLAQARAAMFSKQQGVGVDERTAAGGWQQAASSAPPPPPPGAVASTSMMTATGGPFSSSHHGPVTTSQFQSAPSGSQLDQSQLSVRSDSGTQAQVPWRQNIPPPLQMPAPSNTSMLQRQGSWTHQHQPSSHHSTPRGPPQQQVEAFGGGGSAPHSSNSSPHHGMQHSLDSPRRSSQLVQQGSQPGSWGGQQPSPLVGQPYPQQQVSQWQRPPQLHQQQQQQIPQPPPLQLSQQRQSSFTSGPQLQQPPTTSAVTSWTSATTPLQSPRRWT